MALQLSLFDETPLPEGTIVRQSWPWIGSYDVIFPYWQIIALAHPGFEALEKTERCVKLGKFIIDMPGQPLKYLCEAIPRSVYPGAIHWFRPEDVVPTGLGWPAPPRSRLEPPEENELISLLDTLPVPWRYGTVTRPTFYEFFPRKEAPCRSSLAL
jgi:hypothetical protein